MPALSSDFDRPSQRAFDTFSVRRSIRRLCSTVAFNRADFVHVREDVARLTTIDDQTQRMTTVPGCGGTPGCRGTLASPHSMRTPRYVHCHPLNTVPSIICHHPPIAHCHLTRSFCDCQHIYCGREVYNDCEVRGQFRLLLAFIDSIYCVKGLEQGTREDSHLCGSLQSQSTVRQEDIDFQDVKDSLRIARSSHGASLRISIISI
jgi:hypothetical protein